MTTTPTLKPAVSQRIEVHVGTCPNCDCGLVMTVDVRTTVDVQMQAETGPTEITTDAQSCVQGAALSHDCGTLAAQDAVGPYGGSRDG